MRATYGPVEYSEREARLVLEASKDIIRLVRRVEEAIFSR